MTARARWGSLRELRRSGLLGATAAAALVTASTLLIYPLRDYTPAFSGEVLYVLGVLIVATVWGLRLGVLTAVASALAFDYFHIPPTKEIHLDVGRDKVAIAIFLFVAFVASVIADRARLRAVDAEERLRLEGELRKREAERIRLEEVRASRARVIAAADDERRRVVRDLHDGAQQRLVHTVITLKLAQRALAEGSAGAAELLKEALDHAEKATVELRELSHGILPAVLTRGGLRAGVDSLVSRTPVPVSLDVSVERLPPAIEATAYFVVAEALTNVAKHSRARHAEVSAWIESGVLVVEVRDDGVGGAAPEGGGLTGLRDRLSALDGELRVESPAGGGTSIAARVPMPAG